MWMCVPLFKKKVHVSEWNDTVLYRKESIETKTLPGRSTQEIADIVFENKLLKN